MGNLPCLTTRQLSPRRHQGAYSFVALTRDALYGVRDPVGLRPLCIGRKAEPDGSVSYHFASESCALATIGSEFVREVREECMEIEWMVGMCGVGVRAGGQKCSF